MKSMTKHPLDITHLYKEAERNARNGHDMHRKSRGHRAVVRHLSRKDRFTKQVYPFLNVSLKRKYLEMIHLAEGLGGADDGGIPTRTVRKYLRRRRSKI